MLRRRIVSLTATLAVLGAFATGCATGPVADLDAISGIDKGMAECLLSETEGKIEPDLLVKIVAAEATGTSAQEDAVTRAFINCI